MGAIGLPEHIFWELFAVSKVKVVLAKRVIVPPNKTVPHPPLVLIVYENELVGVPLIVTIFPETDVVTPVGNPVTVTPVAPPPNVY